MTMAVKTSLKKLSESIFHTVFKFIALIPCCSTCQMFIVNFSEIEFRYLSLKKLENCCLVFTSSRECEIRQFHSPNIHIQILQTDLYTFPLRIS